MHVFLEAHKWSLSQLRTLKGGSGIPQTSTQPTLAIEDCRAQALKAHAIVSGRVDHVGSCSRPAIQFWTCSFHPTWQRCSTRGLQTSVDRPSADWTETPACPLISSTTARLEIKERHDGASIVPRTTSTRSVSPHRSQRGHADAHPLDSRQWVYACFDSPTRFHSSEFGLPNAAFRLNLELHVEVHICAREHMARPLPLSTPVSEHLFHPGSLCSTERNHTLPGPVQPTDSSIILFSTIT